MFSVSARVAELCQETPERRAWLARLPEAVAELATRWQLSIGERVEGEGEASWVAPVVRRDGSPAVLKLGMPHPEAEHEAEGLRFWNGDPTVRLLEADGALGAMLLERCEPGTALRELDEAYQDHVLARLARRMWKAPPAGSPFRPLSVMVGAWIAETLAQRSAWTDERLVLAGIETSRSLIASQPDPVLLATDLHAGNVLRAQRETWLVIDPKPFVGDPAYDATQHLMNCFGRMSADPLGTIARYAGHLDLDLDRVRRWMFARLAAGPRDDRPADPWLGIARVIERGE